MTDVVALASQLSDVQFRAMSVFQSGPVTAEVGASRMGVSAQRRLSGSAIRPYVWWGRLMKQLPAGLVQSEWHAHEQELRWSLTPLGSDVLQNVVRPKQDNAA